MSDQWIVIPNWERHQHYKDGRSPVWIKLYTELESRDDWRQLTLSARGLLVCIWLEYARADGALTTRSLPSRVAQKNLRRSLDSLRKAGFIEFSSSPRAYAREVEVERERSSELSKPRRSSSASGQPSLLAYPEWLETLKQKAAF